MQILFQKLVDPIYLHIYHLSKAGKLMMISPSHLEVQNTILELGCKFKFTCDKKSCDDIFKEAMILKNMFKKISVFFH